MKHSIMVLMVLLVMGCASPYSSRSDVFRTWDEEVKLNDGRVIVVNQKVRCDGQAVSHPEKSCVMREVWLTFRLPEFSSQEIVWNEHLQPLVLNVDRGQLYVVGMPPTSREFDIYGKPRPPYIGFRFEVDGWYRMPFEEIPRAIYDTNLVIGLAPADAKPVLTVERKESKELNGGPTRGKVFKRIDSNYKSRFEQ